MAKVCYLGDIPYCVQTITDPTLVGTGTLFPLGVSYDDLIALYWINREFTTSINISIDESGGLKSTGGGSHSYKSIVTAGAAYSGGGAQIKDETGLVCQCLNYYYDKSFNSGWLSVKYGGSPITTSVTTFFTLFANGGFPIYKLNDKYYMYFDFEFYSNAYNNQYYMMTNNAYQLTTIKKIPFSYFDKNFNLKTVNIETYVNSDPPRFGYGSVDSNNNTIPTNSTISVNISATQRWVYA